MLKYSVKLLATAAFENTYSISIFAPAKYPKNSPTHHTQLQVNSKGIYSKLKSNGPTKSLTQLIEQHMYYYKLLYICFRFR